MTSGPNIHGEPVFTLRAKDLLSVQTLIAYRTYAQQEGLDDHALEVTKAIEAFTQWRVANPGKIKAPDHKWQEPLNFPGGAV